MTNDQASHLGVPKCVFSTDAFEAPKRYETFQNSMGVVFNVSRPDTAKRPFSAELTTYFLGDVLLCLCRTVGQHFERTSQMIARDGVDHYMIQTYFYGFTRHRDSRNDVIGEKGKLLVIDTSGHAPRHDYRRKEHVRTTLTQLHAQSGTTAWANVLQ